MSNFIELRAKEHDLIDELVTNALEAASTYVKIIHSGNTIEFQNDGPALGLEKVRTKLLTAYETGEEKSLEINRGLGFIALYASMKHAVIYTGELQLRIDTWNKITVTKSSFAEGFKIRVILNSDAANKYTFDQVKQHLDNWIFWSDIDMYMGRSGADLAPVGRKLKSPLELTNHPSYRYQNLRYSLNPLLLNREITILYKLANIEAYRVLPINLGLNDLVEDPFIDRIILAISHGAYLDSNRRSLTDWGMERVKELLEYVNYDLMMNSLRKKTFILKSEAIRSVENRLLRIQKIFPNLSTPVIGDILTQFENNLTNNIKIVYHLSYFDKLLHLLSFASPPLELPPITEEIYSDHMQFLEKEKIVITSDEFHAWINHVILIPLHLFFDNTVVGFIYSDGSIVSEAKIHQIREGRIPWVRFNISIFSHPVIENQDIIVVLHDQIDYLVEHRDMETDFDQLKVNHGYKLPMDILQDFTLNHQIDSRLVLDENLDQKVRIKVIQGIPCLIYPEYEFNPSDITVDVIAGYNQWKSLIKIILEAYDKKDEWADQVVTVLLFRDDNILACNYRNLIGISIGEISTFDQGLSNLLGLLLPAIHEIAHLYHRIHSKAFSQTQTSIYRKVIRNDIAMAEIYNIFNLVA